MLKLKYFKVFYKLIIAIYLFTPSYFQAQCIKNVNFNNWVQEGNPAYGNWVINQNGTLVRQTINGAQTFLVAPYDLINVEISGKIKVDTNHDDDYIGFVIGYKSPNGQPYDNYNTILFDWKQKIQNSNGWVGQEGYTLSKINGVIPPYQNTQYFKGHNHNPPLFDVIDSKTGNGNGWIDKKEYSFSLIYTHNKLIITIDGVTIFNISDCFESGKFGFYNLSQSDVVYTDFNYTLSIDYEIVDEFLCHEEDTAEFIFIDTTCFKDLAGLDSVKWDFGDGDYLYDIISYKDSILKPKHYYPIPGTYDVKLIVIDSAGCTDTVIKQVHVAPDPGLPGDTTLCSNSSSFNLFNLVNGSPDSGGIWYDSLQPTVPISSIYDPTLNTSGVFIHAVSGLNGECLDSFVNINVNVIDLPYAGIDNNITLCESDNIINLNTLLGGTQSIGGFWNVSGSLTDSLFNPSIQTSADYHHIVNGTVPCPNDTAIVNILVNNLPDAGLPGNVELCIGSDVVDLYSHLNGTPDINGNWSNSMGNLVSSSFDPNSGISDVFTYTVPGIAPCPNVSTQVSVLLNPLPLTNISSDTITIYISQNAQINSSGTGNYSWSPSFDLSCDNCPNPIAKPRESLYYYLEITDNKGCINTDSIFIKVIIPDEKIYIPNAFSPDNDGTNDLFYVRGIDVKSIETKLYNRYGKLVFENNDINFGWDGMYNGNQLNSGVFIYVVNVLFNDDKKALYKGNLSLIK